MTAYITYAHADSPAGPRFLDIAGNAPVWAHDIRAATPEEVGSAPSSARPDYARLLSRYKRLGGVALAVLDCVETHPGVCMITRINTPAKFRGQGIASELLSQALACADAHGVVMTLSIHPSDGLDHDALDAWYRRHGFEPRSCGDGVYTRSPRGLRHD